MPVSADTLRLLMSHGITGDDLIEIVASIDADHSRVEKERSSAAIRQARYRENKKIQRNETCDVTNNVTCDVTRYVTDTTLSPSSPPSSSPPITPLITTPSSSPISDKKSSFEDQKVIDFPERLKPQKPKKTNNRISYHGDFEMLWAEYHEGGKKPAYEAWLKLPEEDRDRCFDGMRLYKADLDDYEKWSKLRRSPPIPLHLSTFINQRHFDDWLEKQELQA